MRVDESDLRLLDEAGFRPLASEPGWFTQALGGLVACIQPGFSTARKLLLLDTSGTRGWLIDSFTFNGIAQCLAAYQSLAQGFETSGWHCLAGEAMMPADEAAFACNSILRGP